MSKFRNLALIGGLVIATLAGPAFAQGAPAKAPASGHPPSRASLDKVAPPVKVKKGVGPVALGRPALPEEIKAWDIAILPDGSNLHPGKGSVKDGEKIYGEQCAVCHGEFGEGAGNYPVLVGGEGTMKSVAPVKSIGSYWPFASTAVDYIHRAMPFGNAQSLTWDETYAIVAYLLNQNQLVPDDFVLSKETFAKIAMPNVDNFIMDDRETAEKAFWRKPCMKACGEGPAKVTGKASAVDVTPEEAKKKGQSVQ